MEEKVAEEIKAAFNDEVTPLQLLVENFFRKQGKVKKVIRNAFPGYVFLVTKISNEQFIIRARECVRVRKSNTILRLLCYGDTNEAAMHEGEREEIASGKIRIVLRCQLGLLKVTISSLPKVISRVEKVL